MRKQLLKNKLHLSKKHKVLSKEKRISEYEKRIFIKNVSSKSKISHLYKFFTNCGKIVKCTIFRNNKGKIIGSGFIQFKNLKAVTNALEKNGKKLNGRPISVFPYISKKSKIAESFKPTVTTQKVKIDWGSLPCEFDKLIIN